MKVQKTLPLNSVTVFVDHRERNSNVIRNLQKYECNVIEKQLEVADFICSSRVGVERKRVEDFLQSIVDNRMFRQLCTLKESYEKPVLILEGYLEGLYNGNINSNAVRGALSHISIDLGIPILWTNNTEETAAQVFWMAKREQLGSSKEVSIRSAKRNQTLMEKQEYLISGLPNVSSKLARRLLRHFKTPERLFRASLEDLKKVEKIGEKKARLIKNVLEAEYGNG